METHRFDIISFIFGGLFLAVTASVLWDFNYEFSISEWVLPGAFLVLGIGILASAVRATVVRKDGGSRQ